MSCDAKGRPIAFSAPMVRAVLREVDPKTQARRIAKFQPLEGLPLRRAQWSAVIAGGHPVGA